ncbi:MULTISPECIES: cation:proton antiporter [unclassified Caballeronia]|uniref:cation:proton antiporter n=1 Tax=unclassified Caballeronia TaxID=2646786 RepID=UPI002862E190|nr:MULTISPECIES: cation:proton antiporter [unclassified Caballeronia]MDR5813556.1 cation:proton antiporter [Caballeronia sp. LZ033]MDR5820313.1 cation:proton antiporter [Caballeronia sp. LZ043]MDR5878130.1 cation:proton antiporter [Caballeronia sp. LZ032]
MIETIWFLVVGGVLIFMGLASSMFRRLPISTAMCYLAIGFALGPAAANLLSLDLATDATVLRRITEVAMLASLFAIGLRLRVPPTDRIWFLPVRLGLVAMVLTVAALTVFCAYVLGLGWGPALLLAAMLAPTDPVLAHDVQVETPGDIDLLRFSLTGEGGLNDGIALPFALLGIAVCRFEASPSEALHWNFALQAAWGISGALASGWLLGALSVRLVAYLRTRHGQALGPEGFYALGLIALSYGVAELLHTYAFLAVFAAGLAMRRVEQKASGDKTPRQAVGKIDADDVGAAAADPERAHAFVAERVHGFTIELERIAEVAIMLMVGALLATLWRDLFTWRAAVLIAALFLVLRPAAVELSLIGSNATGTQRRLMSWFGIRGVGSFYYLLYALEQAPRDVAAPLVPLVIATIAASVVVHGITATPLMNRYQRWSADD